ncbi:DddA-like double-stranded DNA deaminase toxin [Saccharothrix xinjiangensis]|uniref:DddA-like double-stranded DNA deaminase toxin n=1 Tax=Saccharothrix xinjiangensis TaxID=204798 RepID=A0ABV9YBF0_9PSEU
MLLSRFTRVVDGCAGHLRPLLTEALGAAGDIATRLTGGAAPDPPVVPPERIEQLRRELPPPIARGERGRKTHGRWFDSNGNAEPIVSGEDADSDAADAMLKDTGMRAASTTTADVEIKLAARMVRDGIRHATVLINDTPCVGRFGCDTLVPILLPAGATLTVHGMNAKGERFRKRHTGGANPWWR